MSSDLKIAMIPTDIYRGAQRAMRNALLERFTDGTRMLKAQPRRGAVQLLSSSVPPMSQAEARKYLDRCAKHYGTFEELPRVSRVRVWRPAPFLHVRLLTEALIYWQGIGYEVDVRMSELPEGSGRL